MEQILYYWNAFSKLFSTPLLKVGEATITLASVFLAILIFLVSVYAAKTAERFVNKTLSKRKLDRGIQGSLERLARYLVIVIGIIISLDTMGVSVSSLAALGAVLMVGIGFGLQNITQNFISGVILLLERPIKTGDIIRVGDNVGRVLDIRVRSTIVLTRDDVALVVPNSNLVSEVVTNESYTEERIRIHVRVGVAYGSDTQKVKEILLKVATECDKVLKNPSPTVVFENFGDSSLDFDLRIWISDLWTADLIRSDLRFAIDREFREANIGIPFPQMDVHFKSFESPHPVQIKKIN